MTFTARQFVAQSEQKHGLATGIVPFACLPLSTTNHCAGYANNSKLRGSYSLLSPSDTCRRWKRFIRTRLTPSIDGARPVDAPSLQHHVRPTARVFSSCASRRCFLFSQSQLHSILPYLRAILRAISDVKEIRNIRSSPPPHGWLFPLVFRLHMSPTRPSHQSEALPPRSSDPNNPAPLPSRGDQIGKTNLLAATRLSSFIVIRGHSQLSAP